MSRIYTPPRRSNARTVAIAAGAALIGTIVGGASAVGVVMAVVQPPTHDIRADAGIGDATASRDAPAQPQQTQAAPPSTQPVTATAPVQNPTAVPAPKSGQAATTQQASPGATWPDALSARTDHGAATTAATSTAATSTPPPQASPRAGDPSAPPANSDGAAQDHTVPAGEPTVAERAPWPNPVPPSAKAVKRRAAVASEPVQSATPAASAQPTPPSTAADDTNNTPTNKTRNDPTKPRLTQQQPPRSRDALDQGGDARESAAYPPRQRVIIVSPPERDASTERDHWDHGNGLFGLFDFFGSDHRNDERWSNDRWHDDEHD
jgi:hypothetical protein